MTRPLKIAVQGCCHGELNAVYTAIAAAEEKGGYKVDLLIVGGDFQSIRNLADLSCMAVPAKFRKLGDFADYYAGKKTAPVLTIFVGGNHEASNYLQELFYGGWVAPNIYYLGAANVVSFGGLRIGGISGIWSKYDYVRGHTEKAPYDKNSLRSVYHVRQFEVKKLLSMNSQHDRCDIFLSHDWPRGIEQYGDTRKLLRNKPFFKEEVARNDLGSPANEELLKTLRPRYWFCAHLHVRFEASVHHADTGDKRTHPGSVSPGGLHHKAKTSDLVVDSLDKINPDEIDLDLEDETGNPDEIALELPDEEIMNPQDNASSLTAPNPTLTPEPAEQSTAHMSLEEYKQYILQKNGLDTVEPSAPITGDGAKDNVTQFLALDKCLPRRQFLEIMTIPVDTGETPSAQADLRLRYDAKWLAITRTYSPYLSKSAYQKKLPDHATILAQLEADERWICENVSDLTIPCDFTRTVPCQSPEITERSSFVVHQNPQTTKFLQLVGLPIVE